MGKNLQKVSVAGLLVALGIIYGDIGTSPLYVLNAICNNKEINDLLIIGGLSCIIWTLTIQTTVKYVILTLRADNKGEGGIFSLFALVRRHGRWAVFPAMIGGAALLADGMLTPPISVSSAIEGLRNIEAFEAATDKTIMSIVVAILTALFFAQQFGTASIGKAFGPIMLIWFTMLATLGIMHISDSLAVFNAFNPYYAIQLLTQYPKGFWILGAVFLATTGAEALYSDLGHCGKRNIRVSWIFVKSCLILNYLGQGAWILSHYKGSTWSSTDNINPFYGVMPEWFMPIGIFIATSAAIIASQALISGSFTLISEAIKLNLWPKMKINYPTIERGQLFIPGINLLLFAGCVSMVLIFEKSSNMEAAYGLSITICMIMTSSLFAYYMFIKRVALVWIGTYLLVFLSIEFSFLIANLEKFPHGGYIALIVGGAFFMTMYSWFKARKIKNRYVEFVRMDEYVPDMQDLSNDKSIPKYSTHLVYLTSANNPREIEHKVMYSILQRKPKRADIYWFVHVDVLDDPYTMEYVVQTIVPNEIIRVEFRLGFRIDHKVHLMFRKVVEEMMANKEINVINRNETLHKGNIMGDFRFIVLEKFLSRDNELPLVERLIMKAYFLLKKVSLSEERAFGLDLSDVTIEKYPIIVSAVSDIQLKRLEDENILAK